MAAYLKGRIDSGVCRFSWGNVDCPSGLVFIDETGTTTKMTRLRGRCLKGQRLYAKAPFGHWLTQTFVAGLRYAGLTAPWVIDGPMTRRIFETYVETQLAPTLSHGDYRFRVAASIDGKTWREALTPHNLPMTMIGAALLWFGWFGFNAGSNLEANGYAVLAFANTAFATAAAAIAWFFAEWILKGKPSLLGIISGAIAGLVAITPACGFVGINGALIIGIVAGAVCFFAVAYLKKMLGYDDALDAFGVHAVGGIIGAILTGVFVAVPSIE